MSPAGSQLEPIPAVVVVMMVLRSSDNQLLVFSTDMTKGNGLRKATVAFAAPVAGKKETQSRNKM